MPPDQIECEPVTSSPQPSPQAAPPWGYPTDAEDPSAPLAPLPPAGTFLTGTVWDATQVIAWAVQAPPQPLYPNGMAIDDNTPVTILTPPGAGPFATDPSFPVVPGGPVGNPTGSSNIQMNGFWLGDNGTSFPETPPTTAPPTNVTPPPWNGTDSESTYMTNCIAHMTAGGVSSEDAQFYCQQAWDNAQPGATQHDSSSSHRSSKKKRSKK